MAQNASGLTESQLSTLRAKLEAERARLRDGVGLAGAARVATDAEPPDVGDEMDEAEQVSETEEAAARASRESDRLAEVERALGKLARGEYGVSEESGEPIGFARLEAIPWARLTVREEEELDRA